tara:strand:- start:170 stop:961 length:792 start_codon:yes stop_codon:yes gene_type:complete
MEERDVDAETDLPQASDDGELKRVSESSRQRSDATIDVLAYLDTCRPRKIKDTSAESRAKLLSNWCLGSAIVLFTIAFLMILSIDKSEASSGMQLFVLILLSVTALMAVVSLIAPIFVMAVLAFRWKSLAFDGLCGDIRHEQRLAEGLISFDKLALKDAQFWLERRVSRLSSRTTFYLGGKTAVVGMFAATYSYVAGLGGYQWISHTIATGLTLDNWQNTLLLWGGAFLLGFSIGVIIVEKVTDRYRYQIELLELALRQSVLT